MANASDNYGLILPVDGEFIEINDLNYNFEKIDNVMWDNRRISVAMYNTARTYNTGSLAGHEDANGHIHAYRCLADNVTGTWDATKWTLTDLASEIEDIRENAGTEVEANPSGTATDTLEKLRVNSTIYAIPEEVVSKEAEGNPIEITDGASAPLVKCETAITGSQDLHGYDKPWVGGAGKNKAKPSYTGNVIGMTVTEVKDSGNNILAYQFTGTSTGRAGVIVFDFPISNQEKEYRIVRSDVHVDAKTFVWNSTTSSSVPFPNNLVTVPANNVVNLSVVIETGTTLTNATIKFMIIDSAEVDTTFAPYANICPISGYSEIEVDVADADTSPTVENVYEIDLGGTRYGGTLDVVRGVLRVTHEYVDLGDLTWTASLTNTSDIYRYYATISGIKRGESVSSIANILCSQYPAVSMNNTYQKTDGIAVDINNDRVYIYDSTENTVSGNVFASYLSGVECVYELATPLEVSLTPTQVKSLLGNNTIYTDGKTLSIEYITSKYSPITEALDSQISSLQRVIELMITANREAEMIATQNYTAGELLIVSGKLYKASSNIANGSTLVINSNVTSTTIAAELAALA